MANMKDRVKRLKEGVEELDFYLGGLEERNSGEEAG